VGEHPLAESLQLAAALAGIPRTTHSGQCVEHLAMLADVFVVHELGVLLAAIVRPQRVGELGQRRLDVGSRQLAAPPSLRREACGLEMATQPRMLPEELVSNIAVLHDLASAASSVPMRVGRYGRVGPRRRDSAERGRVIHAGMSAPGEMRRVLVVQHVGVEQPGLIGDVLRRRGVETTLICANDPLPQEAVLEASGIVVLGGPMGVYDVDRHPRLGEEVAMLQRALADGKPVLGVCLGSQLLAAALGARVYRGPRKELGWFDVTLHPAAREDALLRTAPPRFPALHWHGDVFDLPEGARHLASSEQTVHQAFAHGRAWGLLFHIEATPAQVAAMANAFPEELAEAGTSSEALMVATHRFAADAERVGTAVFDRWADLLSS